VVVRFGCYRILPLVLTAVLAGCGGNGTVSPSPFPTTGVASPFFSFTQSAAQSLYVDYTGPQRPALSPLRAGGRFIAATQSWVMDAQMAGPVFTGGPNFYVWGVNRGGAGPGPFPNEPNVIFDSVVIVTADPAKGTMLTAAVTLLNAPAGTPAGPASAVLLAPDTIELTVPLASLPPNGFATTAFTWNLWPRSALGGTPAAQIAGFIPQNAEAPFTQF
jgi:hypothetical protein